MLTAVVKTRESSVDFGTDLAQLNTRHRRMVIEGADFSMCQRFARPNDTDGAAHAESGKDEARSLSRG